MSNKRAEKNKRRLDRKKAKANRPHAAPAPSSELIEEVKPRLLNYLKSESRFLEAARSLKPGEVYLINAEGDETQHLTVTTDKYLSLMPSPDRADLRQALGYITDEKVIGYTEEGYGFMTYAFTEQELTA